MPPTNDSGGTVNLDGVPGQLDAAFKKFSNWIPALMLMLNIAMCAFVAGQMWKRFESLENRVQSLETRDDKQSDVIAQHSIEIAVTSANVGAMRESLGRIERSVVGAPK